MRHNFYRIKNPSLADYQPGVSRAVMACDGAWNRKYIVIEANEIERPDVFQVYKKGRMIQVEKNEIKFAVEVTVVNVGSYYADGREVYQKRCVKSTFTIIHTYDGRVLSNSNKVLVNRRSCGLIMP